MDLVNQVQILDKAVSISLCTDAFRKGMNPSFLLYNTDIMYKCKKKKQKKKKEDNGNQMSIFHY